MTALGFDPAAFLLRLRAQDKLLVRAGFPPLSPWWWETFESFLRNRATRRALRSLVLRVGRRGGKSSSLSRLAVCWAQHGPWSVSPGDVGVIPFLSVHRDEANGRLRTIEAILAALSIGHRRTSEGIELSGRPVVFKVFAATTQAVVGFTSILEIGDELAAWRDADTNANPAAEVLSYLAPTRATQPWSFRLLCSSPRSTDDAHYSLMERGDTADQQVAEAPTWVANPTLTEEETHALEPDLRVWAREYAAIPQASVLGAFDADAIERAFAPRSCAMERGQCVLVVDPSSGKKDAWAACEAGWSKGSDGRNYLVVHRIEGVEGSFWKQVSGDEVVERFATMAKNAGIYEVHADQRESLMLAAAFQRHQLKYIEHPWTASNKPAAVAMVRRWLAEGTLVLPEHRKLKSELFKFEERSTPSGGFTFGARGNGHDDYVALLITLAIAELAAPLSGSPLAPSWGTGPLYLGSSNADRHDRFWGDKPAASSSWCNHSDDWWIEGDDD